MKSRDPVEEQVAASPELPLPTNAPPGPSDSERSQDSRSPFGMTRMELVSLNVQNVNCFPASPLSPSTAKEIHPCLQPIYLQAGTERLPMFAHFGSLRERPRFSLKQGSILSLVKHVLVKNSDRFFFVLAVAVIG